MTQSSDEFWCPNGSQELTPLPGACAGAITLWNNVSQAAAFASGVPATIASLLNSFNFGTISSAALCSSPPTDPGIFPFWALLVPSLLGYQAINQWVAAWAVKYWWSQCCTCKPPPVPTGAPIANWSFGPWSGGNLYVSPYNPAYGYASIIWVAGTVQIVGAAGTGYWQALAGHQTPTTLHNCVNGVAFSNQIQQCAWGPGSGAYAPHSNGAYGTRVTSVDMYTTVASQDCVGIAVGKQGTTGNQISGNLELWQQITDPQTYPPDAYPPPANRTGPSGAPTGGPTYPVNDGTITSCNFAPISANTIERIITPQTRVADGGALAITTAGSLIIPGGAVGWTITLTAYPPSYSEDAGDPPQLYQVGWMATSIDGVELSSAPLAIRSGHYQFWNIRPTDHYVVYFLYPGFAGSVQFWNTSTPT